jgi:hypothetical protein
VTDLAILEPGTIVPGILTDAELEHEIETYSERLKLAWRHTVWHAWRLGQLLEEQRRRLGHGNWLPFVDEVLPFERSQAESFLALAGADSQWIGNLPEGTSVTEAVKQWRQSQKTPRPIPPPREASAGEAPLLLRFMVDATSAQVVSGILRVHFPDAQTALDPTYGSGLCWDGTWHGDLTATDLATERSLHFAGGLDFRTLPYENEWFDVVVFDPPHLEDTGAGSTMGERFGTADVESIQQGARECWRVARLGLVVKVTDHVHGQLWTAESDWISEALDWLELYDQVHQVRSQVTLQGHNWDPQGQLSAWNNGATWLVYRKGNQRHEARA